jgi:hypothetical protein
MKIKLPNFINTIQIKAKQKNNKFSGDRLWLTESTFNIKSRFNKKAKKMFIIDDYKFINDKTTKQFEIDSNNLFNLKTELKHNQSNEKTIRKRLCRSQHVKSKPIYLSANHI